MDHSRHQSLGKRPAPEDRPTGMRSSRHPRPKTAPPEAAADRPRPSTGLSSAAGPPAPHAHPFARPAPSAGARELKGAGIGVGGARAAPPSSNSRERVPPVPSALRRPKESSTTEAGHGAAPTQSSFPTKATPVDASATAQRHSTGSVPSDPRPVPVVPRRSSDPPKPGPSGSVGRVPGGGVDDAMARAAAAKKAAVLQAKQAGATGNYMEYDSLFGNYLIPVIPLHLAKKPL